MSVPRTYGWITFPLRLALGGLFVFAGVNKLMDPRGFAWSVNAFQLLPEHADHMVKLIAFAVPWTEVIAGAFLILGLWARSAALVIGLMLAAFIVGISSVLMRGLNVECGCFGKFEFPCVGPVGACHLVRNSVMILAALMILWKGPGALAIDREPAKKR